MFMLRKQSVTSQSLTVVVCTLQHAAAGLRGDALHGVFTGQQRKQLIQPRQRQPVAPAAVQKRVPPAASTMVHAHRR